MARPFDPSTVDWSVFDTEEEQSPLPGIMSQAQHEPQSQFASNLQLADQVGLPVDAVATDPASVRNSIDMEAIDWSQMSTRAPGTADYLIDYNNAVVSRNDAPVLENLEKLLRGAASLTPLGQLSNITADATQAFQSVDDVKRTFEGVGESIGVGFQQMQKGTELMLMDAPDWLTGSRRENLMLPPNLKELVEEAQTQQIITEIQALQQRRQDLTPEDLTLVQEGFRSGAESFAMNAPLIPLMLLPGGQSLALAIMGGQVGSQSYADARADGLEPGAAAAYAAIDAGIEILTERIPTGALAKMLGVDEAADELIETVGGEVTNRFGKEAIKFAISEMGTEQVATLGQSLNAYAFGLDEQLAKAEGAGEIVQIMLDRAAVTAVATAFAGGGQIAIAKGLKAGVEAIANSETKNATQTQKDQMTLDKLNQLATESETRKLSPERFSQFIADNVSEDKNTVYIDSAQLSMYLADKDVRNDAALILLDSKVKEAAAQGVDVAIPTQDFATVVAGTPHFEALRESMTMTEGGVTPFRAVQEREYNNAFLKTMMQDAEANASQYVEAQQIFDSVKAQLVDTGRVTPQEATTMAQIVPAWATSYAVRNGVTVQQVYDTLLPTITGPATGELSRLETEKALLQESDSFDFTPDGTIREQKIGDSRISYTFDGEMAHISSIRTPATKRNKGSARAAMTQFLREADALGIPVKLESSPLDKRTKDRRLLGFYESLGFESTGRTINAVGDPEMIRQPQSFDPDASDSSNLLAQPISTRVPYAKKAKEDALADHLSIGLDSVMADASFADKVISLVTGYSGYKPEKGLRGKKAKLEAFIEQVVDNLLWLHDQVDPEVRDRAKKWYDGANRLANTFSQRYDLSVPQVAAVMAALSPQKDWFMNVSLAERVMDIATTKANFRWSDEMTETAQRIFGKPQYATLLEAVKGKTLAELEDSGLQALWIRTYDQAFNTRNYRLVSPEGVFHDHVTTAKGERAKAGWGSLNEIAKAVAVIKDGSAANISNQMGQQHKVRNFYNNIVDPNNENGSVTIDTHAVAAGLIQPLSGSSAEVGHNFGTGAPSSASTGNIGTYGVYAEAYRRAAERVGLLPREMQSITWEAVRELFPASYKAQEANTKHIESLWVDYRKGTKTLEEVRNEITNHAGGITEPSWTRSPVESDGTIPDSSYQDELPGSELSGRGAGDDAGAGAATSGSIANQLSEQYNQNARGYYDPQNNIIRLTEASNASTFLHEFAHLMYEMELRAGGTMALEIKQWFKRNAADVAAEANGYLAEQPSPVTPAEFRDALNAAKKADKVNGPSVWVGEESDYATMRTVLMDNGKVGFAIQSDGTLTGVFKHPDSTMKGAINTIVPMAVSMGATKLDAFEGPLTEMYSRFGFKETSRSAWDPEQAPADWDYEARGTPDVVFMAIDEATANELTEQARKNQVQNPIPVRRSVGVLEQPGRKTQRAEREADGSLRGLPRSVGRFVAKHSQKISQVAADYMRKAGLDYNPPNTYASVDIERAARIAEAYEAMKHDPQNPEVKAAYEALIEETIEQYKAVMAAGLKVEFIDFSKQGDPYKESPRAAVEDIVDNNHMWVFSTKDGFGSNDKFDPVDNPLLRETEFTISGQPALVNDLFRVVHDYFGHAKEGLGFRAAGEENAWRAHSAMYSPLARRAMTSETRGQNSWVNYGPYGETNRTASAEDTHYADQKIGLLPEWVVTEGAGDADVYLQSEDNPAAFGGEITEDDVTSYMDTGTTGTPEKDAAIRRAAHEQFARGFEQYLLEGKAPSVEMRNIFRTIARWMAQIYDGIRNRLNVNLDDQMRDVFDRMVATEQQIAAAKARAHFEPMFTDAAMAGMTEEQWQQYQIDKEKVSDKAAETVRDQLVKEITRQTKQWWKEERDGLTDDYVAQLGETRRYSTIDSLRNGKVKLDRASVRATVGEQRTDKRGRVSTVIPHQLKDMHIDGGSGVSLDDAAALYGYGSGQELLDDIISAPPIRNEATRMAEEEMKRRHGDVLNDGTIEQLADDAVQNEERAKLILTEMKALRKGTTAPEIDGPSIKAAAEASIAGMPYRNIHPEKYHRAEIRAAQDAATALANGDRDAAARHKLRQAMNYYLFRAASDAKADVLKIVDWTARFRKKDVRTAIAKAGNDYLGQMDKILTRFEFRKAATLKSVDTVNEALALWMARKVEEEGEGLVLSNAVLDESYVTHWKNVPYSDLQGIRDSLKNMEYVARYANKLQIMGEEIDYDKFVQQWTDNIYSNNEKIHQAQRTTSAERRPWIDRAVAHMTKVPWLTRWLDGGDAVGMSQAALMQPLTDALDIKIRLFNQHARPVVDAILNRSKADQARHNRKIFIPELRDANNDGNLYGHQILAVALNVGNDGNLRKMILGEGWATEDQPDLITRDNPKVQAVLQHMTKSDWDLVQLIWDRMDELYPQLAETHRRTTGLTPPKVEAVAIETPYGEYRGGYYPLVYDPARDQRAFANEQRQQAQVDSLFSTAGSIQSSVNASATNERTKYYAPIKLSLDVVPSHFQETIQFISHHDAVRRINKMIRDPRVRKAISETMGPEEFAQLAPWLNDVAKDGRAPPNKTFIDDVFQHLQFGVTLGVMGFKASTGIIQISGLSNSIGELGIGAMSEGLGRVLGSPKSMKEAAEFATSRSKVLPHRLETMDREMRSAFESLQNKRGIMAGVQEAALKHIALIQYYMVDLPTWHAAYAKELNNTGDEAKAERYADWVIENVQGSGATKDMATLLRSQTKTHRIFTMFMTFFSSLWNMSRDLKRGAMGKQYSATTVAAKLMFLYTIPVLFDMLMRGDLAPDEDEGEDWGDVGLAFARNLALFPTQTVPFLRDVANGLVGEYGYDASPVASVIEDGIMAYPKIAEGVFTDEEITASAAKRATQLTGAALGVPGVNQAWSTGEHLYDVLEGSEEFDWREFLGL